MPNRTLLDLLAANRGRGQFSAKAAKDEATLLLYDVIVSDDFFGGVTAKSIVTALGEINAPVIHLRIDSPGGDVFAARAIEQAIREHPSKVIAHIDGLAASAASYVALAADEVVMGDGAMLMIHKAWSLAFGNADDFLEAAAILEKIDGTLVQTYARETGQDETIIRDWMGAETWFTAQEAVDAGFADRIAEISPKASATWDLSAYGNAPIKEQPTHPPTPAAAPPVADTDHLRRRLRLVEKQAA